jgi:internalin A
LTKQPKKFDKTEFVGAGSEKIPIGSCQLHASKRAFTRYNHITSIPEALGQLSKLTWLDLRSNQITFIPEALRDMEKLEIPQLGENPIPIPF